VLVSRDTQKLAAVNADIKDLYPMAETRIIQVDFASKEALTPDYYHNLAKKVEDLDISLVIAAAGTFTIKRYDEVPGKYVEAMLDVNVYHFVMMHKVFLPWLIERRAAQGLRTGLVGFSSISVWRQLPWFGTTYVSTKALASHFGMAV